MSPMTAEVKRARLMYLETEELWGWHNGGHGLMMVYVVEEYYF